MRKKKENKKLLSASRSNGAERDAVRVVGRAMREAAV
jgi:hypothetical protein